MTTKTNNTMTNTHGGKRSGAGRKPGRLSIKTLQKLAVKRELDQRVLNSADQLFNAQYAKAVGSIQVFRIDEKGTGKNKKKVHTLVTAAAEITEVLNSIDGTGGIVGEDFYFITDIPPDNRAIDSMYDRTFGKPNQSLEIIEPQHVYTEDDLARELFKRLIAKNWTREKAIEGVEYNFPEFDVRELQEGQTFEEN